MFNLRRYYAVTSLIGIAVVICGLSYFSWNLALQSLLDHQARSNEDITNSFANSIWPNFSTFVKHTQSFTSPNELNDRSELLTLQAVTKKQMRHTNVVKVKIYNVNGLTVFSTDPKQIGQDKSDNVGFLAAINGDAVSEISFRDEFYAFEQVIVNRNLVASYIPIREDEQKLPVAVFEVYSDVTPLLKELANTEKKIFIGVTMSLLALYLFLFYFVNRAHHLIKHQKQARKSVEERIRFQAFNDTLTGLANRNQFVEKMSVTLANAQRHDKKGALMFLDLDRFKLVNDSLGHDAGDQLLRATASRIQQCMRESDTVFRMSGDEFVVLMENLENNEEAATLATRILSVMNKPIRLNEQEIIVNLSIGVSTFPKEGMGVEDILKEADSAMYRAKQTGDSHFEFFSPEMTMVAGERLSMETDLQRAINTEQFVLYYQPKVDARTYETVGVEALLRWQHPEKGLIPPNMFIPLLEDTGLINQVGAWVINTACQQAQRWIDAELQPLRMSVNISAKQFRNKDLVDTVSSALQSTNIEAQYLELELTESMFVENTQCAIHIMHQLKKLGIYLSIDDFGAGYSSLTYLKQFPVDFLKIDQSFVKDVVNNNKDASITTAISALAHGLELGLIAEGVEDVQQVKILQDIGCDELQGYLFGRPMPADVFESTFLAASMKKAG